ncbi:MAG: hypothetical protein ACK41O_23325, partial [Runella zeae]
MYTLLKKIKTLDFNLSVNNISFVDSLNLLFLSDNLISEKTLSSGVFISRLWCFFSNNSGNYLLNTQTEEIIDLESIIPQFLYKNNQIIAISFSNDYSYKDLILYNIVSKTSTVIFTNFRFGIQLLVNNNLIINEEKTILKS